jgi:hypothetical protein
MKGMCITILSLLSLLILIKAFQPAKYLLRTSHKSPHTYFNTKIRLETSLNVQMDDKTIRDLKRDSSISTRDTVFGDTEKHRLAKRPMFAHFVSWILKKLVFTRTQFVSGLEVHVLSPSNRDILRGRVDTLELKFDKVAYGQVCVLLIKYVYMYKYICIYR